MTASAPPIEKASDREIELAWSRIEANVDRGRKTSRRARRRLLATSVGVAVVLAAGGVAAGAVFTTHTGRGPIDVEDRRLGGPGERLDPTAPDFAQTLSHIVSDVPFPSEQARQNFLTAEVRNETRGLSPGHTVLTSTGALRFWAARSAVCAWSDWLASSVNSGDHAGQAEATQMLERAPGWAAVTDIDARQVVRYTSEEIKDPATGRTTLQRVDDSTPAAYFPLLADAARSGDLTSLAATLASSGACEPYGADMSDLPEANPAHGQ